MRKFLFILLSVFSLCVSAQNWEINEFTFNKFEGSSVKEYKYHYHNERVNASVTLNPFIKDVMLINTDVAFGKFRYNIFTHSITSKGVVKFYDTNGNKVNRKIVKIGLGTLQTNHQRLFGTIKCDDVYEYLTNNTGFVVISYASTKDGIDVDVVIPCVNNIKE